MKINRTPRYKIEAKALEIAAATFAFTSPSTDWLEWSTEQRLEWISWNRNYICPELTREQILERIEDLRMDILLALEWTDEGRL